MNSKILASFLLIVYFVSESYGRDLLVEVKGGKVRKKDTFSTDPYMSVTVCNEKKQTQVVKNNVNPVWNWSNTVNLILALQLKSNKELIKLLIFLVQER